MKLDFANKLADETPDAIVATTLEGNIVFWNKGAESMFGYRLRVMLAIFGVMPLLVARR